MEQTANGANKRIVLHVRLWCGWLSNTTPVSLLVNEFDVPSAIVGSVLHGQVSLTAVNQICVIHEAITVVKISRLIKGLLRKCKYIIIFTFCSC